jgi:hypothetical protein
MIRSRGPPLNHAERITLWLRDFEHPQQNRIKASSLEVEISPPCRHWIIEASLLRAWMSSESIGSPQSSPVLQEVASGRPFSIPPWTGGRGSSSGKNQSYLRRRRARLLKKTSPESTPAPYRRHGDMTKDLIDNRLELR